MPLQRASSKGQEENVYDGSCIISHIIFPLAAPIIPEVSNPVYKVKKIPLFCALVCFYIFLKIMSEFLSVDAYVSQLLEGTIG